MRLIGSCGSKYTLHLSSIKIVEQKNYRENNYEWHKGLKMKYSYLLSILPSKKKHLLLLKNYLKKNIYNI